MQGNQFQLLEYKKPDLSELTQRAHTFKNVMHQRRSVLPGHTSSLGHFV